MDDSAELKRILWKCRRGTKELDELLCGFVRGQFFLLSEGEKELFDNLLDYEDTNLMDWFYHQVNPQDQGVKQIVSRILSTHSTDSCQTQ